MSTETPFHRIKIRTAAVVFNGDDIALIRRVKDGVEQYTLPGGNVEPGEPLPDALARELQEELGLDVARADTPLRFTWLMDAMVSRPGSTPPRKLHMVFRLHINDRVRESLHQVEHDDTAGAGDLVWVRYQDTKDMALFPPVPVAGLAADQHADAALLPGLDDSNSDLLVPRVCRPDAPSVGWSPQKLSQSPFPRAKPTCIDAPAGWLYDGVLRSRFRTPLLGANHDGTGARAIGV